LEKARACFSAVARCRFLAQLGREARIALGNSAAEAASFGANLNIRTGAQNFPQTVYAGGGRSLNVGLGTSTTAPPYSYGRLGGSPRAHEYDRDTQFDGTGDVSTHGKLPK
jgi:hypothetical protein